MGLDASCDALVVLRGVWEASLPAALDGPAAGLLGCRELRVDRLAGEDILTMKRRRCGEVRQNIITSAKGKNKVRWGDKRNELEQDAGQEKV